MGVVSGEIERGILVWYLTLSMASPQRLSYTIFLSLTCLPLVFLLRTKPSSHSAIVITNIPTLSTTPSTNLQTSRRLIRLILILALTLILVAWCPTTNSQRSRNVRIRVSLLPRRSIALRLHRRRTGRYTSTCRRTRRRMTWRRRVASCTLPCSLRLNLIRLCLLLLAGMCVEIVGFGVVRGRAMWWGL